MLMYEGFLDKFYEKLPEVKLAIAFVNFLNSINPNLNCFYKRNSDGVWIKTKDAILIYLSPSIKGINVTLSYRFGSGWGEDFGKYEEKPQEEWTGEIVNFLDTFDIYEKRSNCEMEYESGGVSFKVYNTPSSEKTEFISKLTKENYDNFCMKKDVNKYNI